MCVCSFQVEGESVCNRVKTPGGVILSFTDDSNSKKHEFEFPCQAMTAEENEKRVQKWVEVLTDLKEGKRHYIDDTPPVSQKLHPHSAQYRAAQLSGERSQSVANIARMFGM